MKWSVILLFVVGQSSFITSKLYEYHYIADNKSWSEAQQHCREKHTDLATISNMTDMKRLKESTQNQTKPAWIGLSNQTNVTWYWSLPGLEFNDSETNWDGGKPEDIQYKNCGAMGKRLKWTNLNCSDTNHFVCYDERNASHRFVFIEHVMNWSDAQSYCRENHTDLASGPQQLDDQQLKDLEQIKSRLKNQEKKPVFIGLFRDTWRWSDGSRFSFRHWNFQYNNKKKNQCATTMRAANGKWKSDDCKNEKPFFCYDDKVILVQQNLTWEDALYYCRENHRDLVSITNLDEQRWVQEKVKTATTRFVWMGLRYTCTLDFWFWVSDEVVTYKNWDSGEEMDECDMSGAMDKRGEHKWFRQNDMEEFNFLCSE